MAEFLHKKKGSSLWYYRRRFPQDVAKLRGKLLHMQSLQTTNKREAERLSRAVSVQFDTICEDARRDHKFQQEIRQAEFVATQGAEAERVVIATGAASEDAPRSAESVLAGVPALIRLAAIRVIEEQQRNPKGWQDVIKGWQSFYEFMKVGAVPSVAQRPANEAQAILNGIELAVRGQPFPPEHVPRTVGNTAQPEVTPPEEQHETWEMLCGRALDEYRHKVGTPRYKLALSKLPGVTVRSSTELDIQEGLRNWCNARLREVKPRTVKTQLDCMVSALRCVLPKLITPVLRELKGVMQPSVNDRLSMPVQEIQQAVLAFKNRPVSAKVRDDYRGGASQFDAIAVEVLAVLGLRPRELLAATTGALIDKTDAFGNQGLYFRIANGKNKASERMIPLSDGTRKLLNITRLQEMLKWQEKNQRAPHGSVSALGTRFKKMTGGRTLYQMRHSWKDIAVHAGIDFELRERLLGHKVSGVAAVYGSGIPLAKGLDALFLVRDSILGEKRQI